MTGSVKDALNFSHPHHLLSSNFPAYILLSLLNVKRFSKISQP